MNSVIYVGLVLFGLVLGSFAGAMVWRLRARQLVADQKAGEPVDSTEYARLKKLARVKTSQDRSRCLSCGYELRWYDLIPLISWLTLRGRCRHCHKPIGYMEPLIELGTALFFVISYAFWPVPLDSFLPIAGLATWLVAGVGLAILFAYDTKWYLLPDRVSFTVIGLGLLSAVLTIVGSSNPIDAILNVVGSVAVLSGLYFLIYLASRGRWIGFGDIKLGLGLGLLLADWQIALIALFLANLIGTIVVIPLMATGKLKRDSHVPFGPLLIAGAIVAKFVGFALIEFYTFGLI